MQTSPNRRPLFDLRAFVKVLSLLSASSSSGLQVGVCRRAVTVGSSAFAGGVSQQPPLQATCCGRCNSLPVGHEGRARRHTVPNVVRNHRNGTVRVLYYMIAPPTSTCSGTCSELTVITADRHHVMEGRARTHFPNSPVTT